MFPVWSAPSSATDTTPPRRDKQEADADAKITLPDIDVDFLLQQVDSTIDQLIEGKNLTDEERLRLKKQQKKKILKKVKRLQARKSEAERILNIRDKGQFEAEKKAYKEKTQKQREERRAKRKQKRKDGKKQLDSSQLELKKNKKKKELKQKASKQEDTLPSSLLEGEVPSQQPTAPASAPPAPSSPHPPPIPRNNCSSPSSPNPGKKIDLGSEILIKGTKLRPVPKEDGEKPKYVRDPLWDLIDDIIPRLRLSLNEDDEDSDEDSDNEDWL